MPMLIKHIDAIAREKQRDVLYVVFKNKNSTSKKNGKNQQKVFFEQNSVDWKDHPVRKQIIDWLESQGMGWSACGDFARTNQWSSYQGQIYIDVPYDTSLPSYTKLADFLETPDGQMRLPNALFCYLPLASAMMNVHHDEPGFWEKWAENF